MAVPIIAAEQPADYCDDKASWQQWQQLLTDNLTDEGIASLYSFRIGLPLLMVKSGTIDTQRATRLFEQRAGCCCCREAGKEKCRQGGNVAINS